jgi:hypothetical protein
MMKRLFILLLSLVVCAGARAFVIDANPGGYEPRWNFNYPVPNPANPMFEFVSTNCFDPWTRAIRFYVASDGYSTNNTAAELNAVRASFGQWMSIPGTTIKFEDAGLITKGTNFDINLAWLTNYVFWLKGKSTLVNSNMADIHGLLGLTFYLRFSTNDNLCAAAQIVLNGVEEGWFTDFNDVNNTNFFVEGTVTHEIGHLLGLDHTPSGGSSLFWNGYAGVSTQAGLSDDEMEAARFLYSVSNAVPAYGGIAGRVSFNTTNLQTVASASGLPAPATTNLLGAVVVAEDSHGNLMGCTLSLSNGAFSMPALPPGNYSVRAAPVGAPQDPAAFLRGADFYGGFGNAFFGFISTTNYPVTVAAGSTNSVAILVAPGVAPFELSYLAAPFNPNAPGGYYIQASQTGEQMSQGQSNYIFEVLGDAATIPTNNVVLSVTGDGIDVGPTSVDANDFSSYGLVGLTIPITVHADAVPGSRSVSVTGGGYTFWANGFFRIRSAIPDFNFDGLDDTFQRQYFPLFTAPEAGPAADPDGDGYSNAVEYTAGTNPTNKASFLNIDSVTQTSQGALLSWQSQPGKTFQVYRASTMGPASCQAVGGPFVTSVGASLLAAQAAQLDVSNAPGITNLPPTVALSGIGALLGVTAASNPGLEVLFFDSSPGPAQNFYRVQALSPTP